MTTNELTKTDTAVARLQELTVTGGDWYFRFNTNFEGQYRAAITLPNGYTVSVLTGKGSYSSEGTFEVAVLNLKGEFTTDAFEDPNNLDSVRGWQTADEVFAIAQRAAAL